MSFLRQFLPLLLMPLTISLALLVLGQVRRRREYIWTAIVLLVASSLPVTAALLTRIAEGSAERRPAADAPAADAIVVLSYDQTIAPGPARASEWREANRFLGGLELFQAGKAPLLVFTGAATRGPLGSPSQGETFARYARAWGVSPDCLAITGAVTNTEEEAAATALLLRARSSAPARVLLVTSAYHMPRARRLFEHAGLAVEPFPVDFRRAAGESLTLLDLLPKASALLDTHVILRELYGRLYYRLAGR
jgi:uncharacterized SAM-binding protein YcdF (DUF218 family)